MVFKIGSIVRLHDRHVSMTGRVIEVKVLEYPFGKPIVLYRVEGRDGIKEWINQIYLKDIENHKDFQKLGNPKDFHEVEQK